MQYPWFMFSKWQVVGFCEINLWLKDFETELDLVTTGDHTVNL